MSDEFQDDKSEINTAHVPANKITRRTDAFAGRLEVRPRDQARMNLGRFTAAKPPKGFSVELAPDPDPSDSVATKITSTGTPEEYELVLHVANRGNRVIVAEIQQL